MRLSDYTSGVHYVVTTHKSGHFLDAAIASAQSIIAHTPGVGIHIDTDENGLARIQSEAPELFTSWRLISNPHYRSKIDYLLEPPFERNLYLDSDTRVVDDIGEVFTLLERFDLALAHAHRRYHFSTTQVWRCAEIPPSFPQLNGGVILYRNNDPVHQVMHQWREAFYQAGFEKDQVTLREILWHHPVQLGVLPPEYNIRYKKYLRVWSAEEAKPKILHMSRYRKGPCYRRACHTVRRAFSQKASRKG